MQPQTGCIDFVMSLSKLPDIGSFIISGEKHHVEKKDEYHSNGLSHLASRLWLCLWHVQACADRIALVNQAQAAEQQQVSLVTTALIGKTPDPAMSEFVIDEKTQTIASYPAGHAPISCQYKVKTDSYYAHFNKGTCSTCPLRHHCGVKFQKKTGLVHVSGKTIRRAAYMKRLGEPEYKKLTRLRKGR